MFFIGIIESLENLFDMFIKQYDLKLFDSEKNIIYNIDLLNSIFNTTYDINDLNYKINLSQDKIDILKYNEHLINIHKLPDKNTHETLKDMLMNYNIKNTDEKYFRKFYEYIPSLMIYNEILYNTKIPKFGYYYDYAFRELFIDNFKNNIFKLKINDINLYRIRDNLYKNFTYIYGFKLENNKLDNYKEILNNNGVKNYKIHFY